MTNPSTPARPSGHERIETSNLLMIVLILVTVAIGGLVEIVPLYFQRSTTQPVPGLKPYNALQLVGRDARMSLREAGEGDRADAVLRQEPGLEQVERVLERTRRLFAVAGEHERPLDLGIAHQPRQQEAQLVMALDVASDEVRDRPKPCPPVAGACLDEKIGRLVRKVGDEDFRQRREQPGHGLERFVVARRDLQRVGHHGRASLRSSRELSCNDVATLLLHFEGQR